MPKRIYIHIGLLLFFIISWQVYFSKIKINLKTEKQYTDKNHNIDSTQKFRTLRTERFQHISNSRSTMSSLDKLKNDLMKGMEKRSNQKLQFLTKHLYFNPKNYSQLRRYFLDKEKRYKYLLETCKSEAEIIHEAEKQKEFYNIMNFTHLDDKLKKIYAPSELEAYFRIQEDIREMNIHSKIDKNLDNLKDVLELSKGQQAQITPLLDVDIVNQYDNKPPLTLLMYTVFGERETKILNLENIELNSYLNKTNMSILTMGLETSAAKPLALKEKTIVEENFGNFLIWQTSKYNEFLREEQLNTYMNYLLEEYLYLFPVEVNRDTISDSFKKIR